jgi:hypothetical protein
MVKNRHIGLIGSPTLSLLPALAGFQIGPILLWLTMAVILRRGLAYPSRSLFPIPSSQVADVNPAKAEAQGYG